ncbi:MAG TPA: hypothetical protein VGS08_06105 [Candidatus Saccharimonadales bacterium]|nr:hypothetical protein [Candidatus Saccharimonadales bacterium]
MEEQTHISKTQQTAGHRDRPKINKKLLIGGGVIILATACFIGGLLYQKHVGSNQVSNTSPSSSLSQTQKHQRHHNQVTGTVTAVSSSSITIQLTRTAASRTYSISSSTTVTQNGQTAAVSSIQIGDTVRIAKAPGSSSLATHISIQRSTPGSGTTPPAST